MMDSIDRNVDHCNVSNNATYNILSWIVAGQFALGLPLNLSVLYIFIFRFKFWKNKSIFLFNIVVADFLLVACLPAKAYHYQRGQRRSPNYIMCKTMLFMVFLNRGASIAFLVMLSIDRYFNVVHLGRRNFVKVLKKSPQISVVIWLFLLPLTIPTMLNTFECCNSYGRVNNTFSQGVTDTSREVVFFTEILLPFIILVFCTVRIVHRLRRKTVGDKSKLRRASYVVTSVVVLFSVCFLPSTIARAVLLATRLGMRPEAENVAAEVYDSLMVLSYIDCLLDPLVYCFCHSGFKVAYVTTFCPVFLQKRLLKLEFSSGMGTTTTTTSSRGRTLSLPMLDK
ncbi:12-(S)-hydroxy-5,8,10,14-eicosatetraenoic acid receptor-like [Nerophis lumbriciformis]|uniref:12-(S)-hydroxy-5,8,10,14-eicosatetraenoic acid receptor-like n=1 Tax=Nerophis lumbriciformis TaxID=546530 RepID=UPI002ADFCB47|nr:12-(S)-hydroxy-5,8,10,14-eicosatetraenoic acid receptor-like [Nerophis lumbriciformis]